MKINSWFGLCTLMVPLVLLFFVVGDSEVDALPGRKNRQKNNEAGGGGWFDSNKNKNNFNNNNQGWGSNTGAGSYKKKGGAMKTLKKAAVIGMTFQYDWEQILESSFFVENSFGDESEFLHFYSSHKNNIT